jgi:hypothetical protein
MAISTKPFISFNSMPREGPDRLHLRAAVGYIELAMFEEANAELDEIDPFCRPLPEVLLARLAIYHGLRKWDLLAVVANRLTDGIRKSRASLSSLPTRPGARNQFTRHTRF